MITSVKELHTPIENGDIEREYYNYLICRVVSGKRDRYNLIRINSTCDTMERLGCEITLGHCRKIIKKEEPKGTRVVVHKCRGASGCWFR